MTAAPPAPAPALIEPSAALWQALTRRLEALAGGSGTLGLRGFGALVGALGATAPEDEDSIADAGPAQPAGSGPGAGPAVDDADAALLPPALEAAGDTHLLLLAERIAAGEEALAGLAAHVARVGPLLPAFEAKMCRDLSLVDAAAGWLPPEWRGYYAYLGTSGMRSLILGMGVIGRDGLTRPLPMLMACALYLAGRGVGDPVGTVLGRLRRRDSRERYGLTFLDRPGYFTGSNLPDSLAPPPEALAQVRLCIGVPYVDGVMRQILARVEAGR